MPEAITWYELARTMPDCTMSLAAVEQLANLKVRQAWKNVSSKFANDAARKEARAEIAGAMGLLDTILAVGPTIERESIYASAYKRLAMLEGAAGNQGEEARAIEEIKVHYGEAEKIGRKTKEADPTAKVNWFYPAQNLAVAEMAVHATVDPNFLEAIRKDMAAAEPDFYSVVGQTELRVYESIVTGRLATDIAALVIEFTEHNERVSAPKMWGSVYDNAVFVRAKYSQRATASDRDALSKLLSLLAGFAGNSPQAVGEAPQGSPSRSSQKKRTARSRPKVKKPPRK